jgi:hypothetical protein
MANVYFGDTIGTADDNWNTSIKFTVSGVTISPTVGATYTNNGITFIITSASIASGSGTINAGGSGTSAASGTLTKVSGTGPATINFSSKADVNWFLTQGSVCGADCCNVGYDVAGTPLGRLPTTSDTIIIGNTINIPPYTSPWPSAITVSRTIRAGSQFQGAINAGTFTNTITVGFGALGGSIICNGAVVGLTALPYLTINGGTFNNTVTSRYSYLNGGIFNSTVSMGTSSQTSEIIINGNPTFNGTIVNPRGTTARHSGTFRVQSGNPVFNCAIPDNVSTYELNGGVYDRSLVIGLVSPTVSPGSFITIGDGFSTSQNITINSKRSGSGYISITGGIFRGILTINRLSSIGLDIYGGSYYPPAVTTPAIKIGSKMTFNSSIIPINPGFGAAGGTFNPTVLLSGTTNDIIGSGLQ